jgi:succinate dehydrogenase / fumarate reductase membrane anchor subunit
MAEGLTMVDHKIIANPTSHYGNPRAGTRNFIVQRVTGALNIVFTAFLIWFVVTLAGPGRADAIGLVHNPIVGIMLILLLINVPLHMRIGMHEVIADYVDEGRRYTLGNTLNNGYAMLIAVVGVLSVLKIMIWG